MFKNTFKIRANKSSLILLTLTLVVGGVGAQVSGVLGSPTDAYLVCVDSKSKIDTHLGTTSCPEGSVRLVGVSQDVSESDGSKGNNGKLWIGINDPGSKLGKPGDIFINSTTKTLFGPKSSKTSWGIGFSMVGSKGDQGAPGTNGTNGTNATLKITELSVCDGEDENSVADELCKIGMTGPGGGPVFFVDYFDQHPSFCAPMDCNYLEAAKAGWGAGIIVNRGGLTGETTGSANVDPLMKWCSISGTLFNPSLWTNAAVGKGSSNTSTADVTCTGGAIQAAADYEGNDKTDWFLPSIGEAMLMYENMRQLGVGAFSVLPYWSSSESGANNAWRQYFNNGNQETNAKNTTDYVRPVRAF